jgi:hypothetical protein
MTLNWSPDTILCGDALSTLRSLQTSIAHTRVKSRPYPDSTPTWRAMTSRSSWDRARAKGIAGELLSNVSPTSPRHQLRWQVREEVTNRLRNSESCSGYDLLPESRVPALVCSTPTINMRIQPTTTR